MFAGLQSLDAMPFSAGLTLSEGLGTVATVMTAPVEFGVFLPSSGCGLEVPVGGEAVLLSGTGEY